MFTTHAKCRMQQRAVSLNCVEAIINFGDESIHANGAIYLCTKRVLKRLIDSGMFIHKAERCKGIYVVVQDGVVRTVAHRYKRIYRK
jgi:hypothetical protein